jgi:hypothetical protein
MIELVAYSMLESVDTSGHWTDSHFSSAGLLPFVGPLAHACSLEKATLKLRLKVHSGLHLRQSKVQTRLLYPKPLTSSIFF